MHKITGNLTICSIVCSVIDKEKKMNYTILVFSRQIHRLSPVALTNKGQQSGQRSMILQPARAFSTLFFNILTKLDYFLQSKTTWFKSRHAFVLLTFPHSVPEKTKIIIMELPNMLWNSVDISIMELLSMYIMELHHVDDGSPQIVWSSITANCRAPWIELWIMDLHR